MLPEIDDMEPFNFHHPHLGLRLKQSADLPVTQEIKLADAGSARR
jgi:hypothetical protein